MASLTVIKGYSSVNYEFNLFLWTCFNKNTVNLKRLVLQKIQIKSSEAPYLDKFVDLDLYALQSTCSMNDKY